MRFVVAAVAAALACASAAGAATTVNWDWSGNYTGSGQLTYDANGVVTALNGTYNGQALSLVTFTSDPNNSGAALGGPDGNGNYTYHGVPNTNGADYIFDNKVDLTVYGILVSTGTGASERVYDLSLDGSTPDFFSINPDGSYRDDHGRFTTSAVQASPAPEPASWATMLAGFGLMGAAMRRRRVSIASSDPIGL